MAYNIINNGKKNKNDDDLFLKVSAYARQKAYSKKPQTTSVTTTTTPSGKAPTVPTVSSTVGSHTTDYGKYSGSKASQPTVVPAQTADNLTFDWLDNPAPTWKKGEFFNGMPETNMPATGQTYQNNLQRASKALEKIMPEYNSLQGMVKELETRLAELDEQYRKTGNKVFADQYNIVYANYKRAVGNLQKLYADNEELFNAYNAAAESYNSYLSPENIDKLIEAANAKKTETQEYKPEVRAWGATVEAQAGTMLPASPELFAAVYEYLKNPNATASEEVNYWANDPYVQSVIESGLTPEIFTEIMDGENNWRDVQDSVTYKTDALDEYTKTLQADRDTAQYIKYMSVMDSEDFEENVASGKKKFESDGAEIFGLRLDIYTPPVAGVAPDAPTSFDISPYFTEDEAKVFYHLVETDPQAARQFYEFMTDTLNAREGHDWAQTIQDLPGILEFPVGLVMSLASGIEGGLRNVGSLFTGKEAKPTPIQYATGEMVDEGNWLSSRLYSGGGVIGNMLPSIGVGAINPVAGSAMFFMTAAGGAYNQGLQMGMSKGEAYAYGGFVGSLEVITNSLIGSVGSFAGLTDDVVAGWTRGLTKSYQRVIASGAIKIVGEVAEEELQLFLEPLAATLVAGVDYDAPTWQDMLDTAVITAFSTAGMSARGVIHAEINYKKYGNLIQKRYTPQELIAEAQKLSADTKTAQIVGQLTGKNVSASDVGRLYAQMVADGWVDKRIVPGTVASADSAVDASRETSAPNIVQTIQKRLVDGGMDVSQAETTAQSLARILGGDTTVTNADKNVLSVGNKVARELFEAETGVKLPSSNSSTRKVVSEYIAQTALKQQGSATSAVETSQIQQAPDETASQLKDTPVATSDGESVLRQASMAMVSAKKAEDASNLSTTVRAFGKKGQEEFRKYLPNAKNKAIYTKAFENFYDAGRLGYALDKFDGKFGLGEDPTMLMHAYRAGIEDAPKMDEANPSTENKNAQKGKKTPSKGKGNFYDNRTSEGKTASDGKTVTKAVVKALKLFAKVFNIDIELVDSIDIGEYKSVANGKYDHNARKILLAADSQNHLMTVLKHEVTHHIQRVAPKQYEALKKYVMKTYFEDSAEAMNFEINERIKQAKKLGITLTRDGAMDEIVADATERFLTDRDSIDALVRENRSLGQTILNAIRDVLRKIEAALTGVDVGDKHSRFMNTEQLRTAEKMWVEALMVASQNENTTTLESDGDGQFQFKGVNSLGIEVYETSDAVMKMSVAERNREYLRLMNHEYAGRTAKFVRNGHAYYAEFDEGDLSKQVYGEHRSSKNGKKALVRAGADGDIFNLVEKAKYTHSLPDRKNHKDTDYFDYFVKTVQIDGKVYDLLADVKKKYKDGKHGYVYTLVLTDNKKIKAHPAGVSTNAALQVAERTLTSGDIVPHPEESVNGQFSLKTPVEQTKNLIALHNLNEEKLLKALDLGGFPMPSIAVTKTDIPHTNFGDITLVMNKSTIDPQASKKNTVYSADAWTPTFPQVEYDVNDEVRYAIYDKSRKAQGKIPEEYSHTISRMAGSIGDYLRNYGSEDGVVERFKDEYAFKALYLADKGEAVETKTKEVHHEKKTSAIMDEVLGLFEEDVETLKKTPLNELHDKYAESIKQVFINHGKGEAAAEKAVAKTGGLFGGFSNYMSRILDYAAEPAHTTETVTDTKAIEDDIDSRINEVDYEKWLSDLFRGLIRDTGIRNSKEVFTPSGNRRSFKSTHYPVTLDNIAKAMAEQNGGNSRNVSGFYGVKSLRAGTAERFKSIADMHKMEGRLQHLTQEQATAITDALDKRLTDIIGRIYDKKTHSRYDNAFMEYDVIGNNLMEVTEQSKYTIDSIVKVFAQYGYNLDNQLAADIRDLLFDVSEMPVNIFEAKPERAVRFDEVLAAIIPDSSSDRLRSGLEQAGVNTMEYKSGDDAARMDLANSVEGAQFSLKDGIESGDYTTRQIDWAIDNEVISKKNKADLIRAIDNEIYRGHNIPRDKNGNYIVESGNVMMFTNGDRHDPSLDMVVVLDDEYETFMARAKEEIYNGAKLGDVQGAARTIGRIYWDGYASIHVAETYRTNGGNVRGGKRSLRQILADEAASGEEWTKYLDDDYGEGQFSLKSDSTGKELTKGQQEFFKDSKVRDENGRLMVMYHGTNTPNFTVFDPSFSDDGISLFFTNSPNVADSYTSVQHGGNNVDPYRLPHTIKTMDEYNQYMEDIGSETRIVHVTNDVIEQARRDVQALIRKDKRNAYLAKRVDELEKVKGKYITHNGGMNYITRSEMVHDTAEELIATETNDKYWTPHRFGSRYSVYLNLEKPYILDTGKRHKGNGELEIEIGFEDVEARFTVNDEDFVIKKGYKESYEDFARRFLSAKDAEKFLHKIDAMREKFIQEEMEFEGKSREDVISFWEKHGGVEVEPFTYAVKNASIDYTEAGVWKNLEWEGHTGTTRDLAKWANDNDYDGVIFKNLKDIGGYSGGTVTEAATVAIAFDSNKVKSTNNLNPTSDPDIRFQLKTPDDVLDMARQIAEEEHKAQAVTTADIMKQKLNAIAKTEEEKAVVRNYQNAMKKLADYEKELAVYDATEGEHPKSRSIYTDASGKVKKSGVKYSAAEKADIQRKIELWKRNLQDIERKEAFKKVLKREKAKMAETHAKKMSDLREAYNKRMDALRDNRDAKVEAEKQKMRDYKQHQRDSKEHKELKGKLEKDVKWLGDRLVHPTDAKHIPEDFKKVVAKFLESLDFTTKGMDKNIAKTGKPSQKFINMWSMIEAYQKIANDESSNIVLTPIEDAMLKSLKETFENGRRVEDLDYNELEMVYDIIRWIKGGVATANNAFNEEIKETISEMGESTTKELRGKKSKKEHTGLLAEADKLLGYDNITPADMFHRFGGTMEKMYKEIRKGFNKHIENVRTAIYEVSKITNGHEENIKEWSGKKAKATAFTVSDGTVIELTPAQVMSLYVLMKREQAVGHVLGSGIVPSDVVVSESKKVGKNITLNTTKKITAEKASRVTFEDVAKIVATLDEDQKRIADGIVKLFTTKCADWGNETSMKLFNMKKFVEKNYFPIKSSDAYLNARFDDGGDVLIKNLGMTKNTVVNANNPIVVEDIFDVLTDHVNKMSMYNALVVPLTDFTRVYNSKVRDGDGNITDSVHMALEAAHGKQAIAYVTQFMKDVNKSANTLAAESLANKALSAFKKAKVGANLRVLAQQPTSIVRAAAIINPKYLAKGAAQKANYEELFENSEIAYWKHLGFFETDIARSMKDILMDNESTLDKVAMGPYGKADDMAWMAIWNAVKLEQADAHPDVDTTSSEFMELVKDRFEEIVDRTQVVDSVFHRSQLMRSKSVYTKMLTAFMSEPTKTYNLLVTDLSEAIKSKDGKKAGRVIGVFVTNGIATAMAAAIVDAFRDDDDEDEEGNKRNFWDKYVDATLENTFDNINPASLVPYVKDFASIIAGYEVSRTDMAAVTQFLNVARKWTSGKHSFPYLFKETAASFADLFGYPVKNAIRDLDAIINTTAGLFGGLGYVDYWKTKARYNISDPDNRSKFYKCYTDALLAGNEDDANKILADMVANGIPYENIIDRGYQAEKKVAFAEARKLLKNGKTAEAKTVVRKLAKKYDKNFTTLWKTVREDSR